MVMNGKIEGSIMRSLESMTTEFNIAGGRHTGNRDSISSESGNWESLGRLKSTNCSVILSIGKKH